MFRAGDPRPQAHDMKANRSESNEGPRAKSDCPRSVAQLSSFGEAGRLNVLGFRFWST